MDDVIQQPPNAKHAIMPADHEEPAHNHDPEHTMIVSSQQPMRSAPITQAAVRSRGMAILAFAVFGAWWATSALQAGSLPVGDAGYLLVALVTVALLFAAVDMLRSSRRLASAVDAPNLPQRRTARVFLAVFAAEIIAINLAAWLLTSHHLSSYLIPLIAIVVGLHFHPLASLFHTPHYHLTATAMTLAGAAGVVAQVVGYPAVPTNAAVGAICAVTLWITAFVSWRTSQRALVSARAEHSI